MVVDDPDELLWRLRALWRGQELPRRADCRPRRGRRASTTARRPQVARDRYKFDIVDVTYDDLGKRIAAPCADAGRMRLAERWTDAYLALPGTTLRDRAAVRRQLLRALRLFKDLMREHNAAAVHHQQVHGHDHAHVRRPPPASR